MAINPKHTRYLEGYSLDHINYEVIDIIPQNERFAVIIMRDRRSDAVKPWCVQYKGNGHYFLTRDELDDYCSGRGFKGW